MISEEDKQIIISQAKAFNVREVYLFGSSLEDERRAADIDLAVKGISPEVFFDFYGKLLRCLTKVHGNIKAPKEYSGSTYSGYWEHCYFKQFFGARLM